MIATSTEISTIDDPTAASTKKGKNTITSPTMKTKITRTSNHWSLISFNVSGLKSLIKKILTYKKSNR